MRVITDVLKNDDVLHSTLTHVVLILVLFKWPEVELCKKKEKDMREIVVSKYDPTLLLC